MPLSIAHVAKVAAVVQPPVSDPGSAWSPFTVTELLDIDVLAPRRGEQQWRIDPRWHLVELVQHDTAERHRAD
jgi:hypothetical protein